MVRPVGRLFLTALLFGSYVSWGSVSPCLDPKGLETAIKSGKFHVLTVTRDCLEAQPGSQPVRDDYQLSKADLADILSQAGRDISWNDGLPVFVVLSEYFCSRRALEAQSFCELLDEVKSFSRQKTCGIFYVNFLYKLPKDEADKVDTARIRELLKYTTEDLFRNVGDSAQNRPWSSVIFGSEDVRRWLSAAPSDFGQGLFANETFVIHNGFVLARYKKSTYCHEDDSLIKGLVDGSPSSGNGKIQPGSRWLYAIGDGTTELVIEGVLTKTMSSTGVIQAELSNERELAKVLVANVQTTICLDLSAQVHRWAHRVVNSFQVPLENPESALVDGPCRKFFANYESSDGELKGLRALVLGKKDPQLFVNPDDFKLQIIQSNSIAVADYVLDFPQWQIVVQSDPSSTCVFRVDIPDHVKRFAGKNPTPRNWIAKMSVVSSVLPFPPRLRIPPRGSQR